MKRIAIYGIGGLYNYGCEAIVRGTVELINRIYPNSSITYYSKCFEYDKKQISDLSIKLVNIESKSNILKKTITRIVTKLGIEYIPFTKKNFKKIIEQSDVIFSVGGDIYSIPEYMRKEKKYRYVNELVEFGKYAKKQGKKLIIYGASIGPFGEYNNALQYFIKHLKQVDYIFCREKITMEYLRNLGISKNTSFLPDPAFIVSYKNITLLERRYIGINLSELSLKELYGNVKQEDIEAICVTIKNIYLNMKMPIMLIPHVVSPVISFDNDLIFLSKIYRMLDESVKENTILVEPKGFLDAKEYLKQCKLVICARMHCAVNALTVGTPTVFLSYSIKSKGMTEYIYDTDRWILSLKELHTNKLIEILQDMNKNLDEIGLQLYDKMIEIEKYYIEWYTYKGNLGE